MSQIQRVETRFVNAAVKGITRMLCQVDESHLPAIPPTGPLILVTNHVNFLDVPVLYTHLLPRPVTGFAKVETWDNPLLSYLFSLWGAIPIHRGEPDVNALRQAVLALRNGKIVAIAPEGTRSGNGVLGPGLPGVVMVAQLSRAPLLPVAYHGHEFYTQKFSRLQRPEFNIRVGRPFILRSIEGKINKQLRQIITDEIMFQLARILPVQYRGYYSDLTQMKMNYLEYL